MSTKQKLLLSIVIIIGLILALMGGFRGKHIDTEYSKTLYNKSYYLHTLYDIASRFEFAIKSKLDYSLEYLDLTDFKERNEEHAWALYFVNGCFVVLGLVSCFQLAFLLSSNFYFSLLASAILATCYFWNAEAHYPTTDIALSSFCITLFTFLFTEKKNTFTNKLIEGFLLGSCFAIKYFGLVTLLPYLYFKFKRKELTASIKSIITAFTFLVICMGDKLLVLLRDGARELSVQTQQGWAGYNSAEPGFIYHLKHSFITEYGLSLTILALFGFYYLYKESQKSQRLRLEVETILSFIIICFIVISSTKIKTVRFALPLIPVFAIASSFGIRQIHEWFKNKLTTSILILIATMPALYYSTKHAYLMYNADTLHIQANLKSLVDGKTIVVNDKLYFDKTPAREDKEYKERCTQKAIDFQKVFYLDKDPSRIISLNSYRFDRFIYDADYHCPNAHKAFGNFEDLKVLQISPFKVKKELVPFSFISNFSPRKPDIDYRNHKGGFFEFYYKDPQHTEIFQGVCEIKSYPCHFTNGSEAFFLNHFQTAFRDPKRQKINLPYISE